MDILHLSINEECKKAGQRNKQLQHLPATGEAGSRWDGWGAETRPGVQQAVLGSRGDFLHQMLSAGI